MGAWGYRLFEDDLAADIRDAFRRLVRLPVDGDGLLAAALEAFPPGEPGGESWPVTWLALAELFHRYGIEHPSLFERAAAIVADGSDDANCRALGMDERDMARRRKHLAELSARWNRPNPSPAARTILHKPQPHFVEAGDIWLFPAVGGMTVDAAVAGGVQPDGWGAFAVAANAHRYGLFAESFVLRLHLPANPKPDLAECINARISGVRYGWMSRNAPPAHACAWVEAPKAALKSMRAERIGALSFDWDKVEQKLNGADMLARRNPALLKSFLSISDPLAAEALDEVVPLDFSVAELLR